MALAQSDCVIIDLDNVFAMGQLDAIYTIDDLYRKISNIRRTNPKLNCFSSRRAVVFAQSIEARC